MGMGLLLSALSGAGNGITNAAQQYQKAQDEDWLAKERSDADLAKAKAIADYNVGLENQKRQAMTGRISAEQNNIISNAIDPAFDAAKAAYTQGGTYVDESGAQQPITDEQRQAAFDAIDQNRTDKKSAMQNNLQLKAQAAIASGDYQQAMELIKMADAGKVTAGYGAKVVDQNDIDPTTGLPRVIIDNTAGRDAYNEARANAMQIGADARQSSADAAQTRADAYSRKIDDLAARGNSDLKDLGKQYTASAINLNKQIADNRNALLGAKADERLAISAKITALQQSLDGVTENQRALGDVLKAKAVAGAPASSQAAASPDKFVVGKKYTSNGITKTYTGNGKWE